MARTSLNAEQASKSFVRISESLRKLTTEAVVLNEGASSLYEESDLNYVKVIAESIGEIKTSMDKLSNVLDDTRAGLNKYVNEMEDYSDDITGL